MQAKNFHLEKEENLHLEKEEKPEIKLPTFIIEKGRELQKKHLPLFH